jgi:hypothetical protein
MLLLYSIVDDKFYFALTSSCPNLNTRQCTAILGLWSHEILSNFANSTERFFIPLNTSRN